MGTAATGPRWVAAHGAPEAMAIVVAGARPGGAAALAAGEEAVLAAAREAARRRDALLRARRETDAPEGGSPGRIEAIGTEARRWREAEEAAGGLRRAAYSAYGREDES